MFSAAVFVVTTTTKKKMANDIIMHFVHVLCCAFDCEWFGYELWRFHFEKKNSDQPHNMHLCTNGSAFILQCMHTLPIILTTQNIWIFIVNISEIVHKSTKYSFKWKRASALHTIKTDNVSAECRVRQMCVFRKEFSSDNRNVRRDT